MGSSGSRDTGSIPGTFDFCRRASQATRKLIRPSVGRPCCGWVNQAEGLAEYAKQDDVLILRTVDNQRYIGVYNHRGNPARVIMLTRSFFRTTS